MWHFEAGSAVCREVAGAGRCEAEDEAAIRLCQQAMMAAEAGIGQPLPVQLVTATNVHM